jgi:translocation and assembly module TamA
MIGWGRPRAQRWVRLLAGVSLGSILNTTPALPAETGIYRVEIGAPDPLAKLLTANLDIVRWSKRSEVTRERLEQLFRTAPAQVKEILATEGYFSARVEPSLEQTKDGPVVRFVVEPGEPARVTHIDLTISGPVTEDPAGQKRIEHARRAFRIKTGDVFRQPEWNAAKQRVVASLAGAVYANAHIESSRAQIDPVTRSAVLQLDVASGPPVAFGELKMSGLERYGPKIVANLNPIQPGTPYDGEALLKFQRRLLASGYFASALVSAEPDRKAADKVGVSVTLVEAPSQRVEFGVGYSTDRGPRGQIDYSDKNLLDRAWRLSSNLSVDRLSQQVTGGVEFPRHEDGWRYAVEGKFKNEDIQGQRITNWSVTGARLYTVEEYESALSLQFLTERSSLEDGSRDDRDALFLGQNWTWNGLDEVLNPRKGYLAKLQVGGATKAALSTEDFGRAYGKASYLWPFNRRWTLGLRSEAGLVVADSRAGIPSAYVFRTGGDTTIRGYAFESLGVAEGDAVVGGRYLLLGSVELTHWITRKWGAAVFYDIGNAFDDWHRFDPVAGYGAGVRWRSPIGSLSLDLAYGEDTGRWRVHFNAGFAF